MPKPSRGLALKELAHDEGVSDESTWTSPGFTFHRGWESQALTPIMQTSWKRVCPYWLWLCLVVAPTAVHGQEIIRPGLAKMTAGEFGEWLSDSDNLNQASITRVLDTRRLDLIEILVKNHFHDRMKRPVLIQSINTVIDSEFKDFVTLLALRNDPRDTQISFGRQWKDYVQLSPLLQYNTPYRSIILKYFPGFPLRDGLITRPAARNTLADSIEEVKRHPERMEAIRKRLDEISTAPGAGESVQPIRTPTELKQIEQNFEAALEENAKREGTVFFDPDLSAKAAQSRRYILEELRAAEWIEAHAKSTDHKFHGLRPASATDPATLPVQAPPRAREGNDAGNIAEWRFWSVLGGMGLALFCFIQVARRRHAFRGHGI